MITMQGVGGLHGREADIMGLNNNSTQFVTRQDDVESQMQSVHGSDGVDYKRYLIPGGRSRVYSGLMVARSLST